jgi:hypothetical protein
MTEQERRFMIEKCGHLLQCVLVEIRNLSFSEGNGKQIHKLADLTHNIPIFMIGGDDSLLTYIRNGFLDYSRSYQTALRPEMSRYVQLLDMDEPTFAELHRPEAWPPPQPMAAAG